MQTNRDVAGSPVRQHSAIMLQKSVVGAAVQTQVRPRLQEQCQDGQVALASSQVSGRVAAQVLRACVCAEPAHAFMSLPDTATIL